MILRENVGLPPGGVLYVDPRNADTAKLWANHPSNLDSLAQKVFEWRSANPNIYDPVKDVRHFNFQFIRQQITDYNCQRLGFNPQWCIDETKPQVNLPPPRKTVCDVEGAELQPVYCQTCAGKRILSYKCSKCGREYPK
jgi:hypothetical protein